MKPNPQIAQFFGKPLALYKPVADALAAQYNAGFYDDFDVPVRQYGFEKGVAIIPVRGILAAECPWWMDGTSYSWIREGFDAAVSDPDVKAIVLDVNSPGGTVEGCFDLVDHIYASRGTKPIWAIQSENAYSAAYALASAADRIILPRTGGAGSIGVVACHVDVSDMLEKFGVKVTYIQYGARKTDGASEKPLSDEALACFQSEVDVMGELFVATVARNRGLAAQKIKDTEAATFMGPAAVSLGLCDEVLAPDAAFQALLQKLA